VEGAYGPLPFLFPLFKQTRQMKVIGQFNKISEALKKTVKPLLPGQQVNVRLINGNFDIVSGEIRFGNSQTIVCRDVIRDGENLVEIGVPKDVVKNEVTRVKKIYISAFGENLHSTGMFTLDGSNIEHQEFYWFLSLWNKNKSNPNRDTTTEPVVEFVNDIAEAEAEALQFETEDKARFVSAQMSEADLVSFAAVMNWNTKTHPKVLRNMVRKYAIENPEEFLLKQDDPELGTKILIKSCLDKGLITYRPDEHKMIWANGTTLAKLDKGEHESPVENFFGWLQAAKSSENILRALRNADKNSD
jgi:hypothetical protein